MITKTRIDWCDYTWDPVWGCERGCEYCYAEKIAKRFHPEQDFKKPWFKPKRFNSGFPKQPSIIFVNSMSDPAYWENNWVKMVIGKISAHPQHNFLFLTKSPQVYDEYNWPSNCWLGVTITNQDQTCDLSYSDFENKEKIFFSIEPILEPVDLPLMPDWIIIGAETGNRKEKIIPAKKWIMDLVYQIRVFDKSRPVFMKDSLREIMENDFIQQFPEGMKK